MNKATQSKINWTAAFMAVVNLAAILGWLPEDSQTEIATLVNMLGPALILVFRTWFTGPKEGGHNG